MKSFSYVIKDELGLHARPAGILVKRAASFSSEIKIKNEENGKEADCKRVIGVMSLGVKKGNKVTVSCLGGDEGEACAELEKFMKENV